MFLLYSLSTLTTVARWLALGGFGMLEPRVLSAGTVEQTTYAQTYTPRHVGSKPPENTRRHMLIQQPFSS